MAPNFSHSIFDPLSCTGTQWIVDRVMIEHYLHSVLICDIHTARFPLDCSRAAVCPCTLFRVRCRPHSEGCAQLGRASRCFHINVLHSLSKIKHLGFFLNVCAHNKNSYSQLRNEHHLYKILVKCINFLSEVMITMS